MLKAVKGTWIVVEYGDLDRAAKEAYGFDPEVAVSEELGNDTAKKYKGIDGALDRWDAKALADFIQDGTCSFGIARVLLNALVRDKLAEPGDYILNISW